MSIENGPAQNSYKSQVQPPMSAFSAPVGSANASLTSIKAMAHDNRASKTENLCQLRCQASTPMCQVQRFSLERTTVHENPGKQPPTPVTQTVPSRHAPTTLVTNNVPSKHADASSLALSLGENSFPQQAGKQHPTSVTQTELEENNGPRRQGKQHPAIVTRNVSNKYAPRTRNYVVTC